MKITVTYAAEDCFFPKVGMAYKYKGKNYTIRAFRSVSVGEWYDEYELTLEKK